MDIWLAIILGIVEGLTEFLPVSSTGHLILANRLLGFEQTEFLKTFEIVIQLGAILSVVFLYRRQLLGGLDVWKKIITAFIPTALIGYFLYDFIKSFLLESESVVLWSLLVGGLLLIILETRIVRRQTVKPVTEGAVSDLPSYRQSLIIGLCQALSVVPGVSRSAATIMGGMLLGLRREAIVEFSFLLAIPTMLAASGLDLLSSEVSFSLDEWIFLSVGFAVSFVVALASVKFLTGFVKRHTFIPFGLYRIIVAGLLYIVLFV